MNFQDDEIDDAEGLCRRITDNFYDGVKINPSLFEDPHNDLSVDSRSNRNDEQIFEKQIEVYFKTRKEDPSKYPAYLGFAETQYNIYKLNDFTGKRTPTVNKNFTNEFHCSLKFGKMKDECEFKKAIIEIRNNSVLHFKK